MQYAVVVRSVQYTGLPLDLRYLMRAPYEAANEAGVERLFLGEPRALLYEIIAVVPDEQVFTVGPKAEAAMMMAIIKSNQWDFINYKRIPPATVTANVSIGPRRPPPGLPLEVHNKTKFNAAAAWEATKLASMGCAGASRL